ncbi:MAG: 4,5-DOPA dioxygenase extradiol [Polaromonas sp.]|nr:4,5-DOPA dioxygenase extradiol [Polaromonas sp.]
MTEDFNTRRRQLLVDGSRGAVLATLSSLASLALAQTGRGKPPTRMPSIFIGHGSPMNAIQDNGFTRHLTQWGRQLGRPAAILSVSAHWLTPGQTAVGVQDRPRTLHDFSGFPAPLHAMQYPAPGAPGFARQAAASLKTVSTDATEDWGLDHGTWTVLHHLFPKADIPVFQLSIDYAQPAAFHYRLGRELAALREQGVLVLGSGNVVHNLRATERGVADSIMASKPWAQSFDNALRQALLARDDHALVDYARLDAGARMAVPTPDHYWPFLYALGAAGAREKSVMTYEGFQAGTISMRCVQWG